ncbi:MAG TPA: 6-phosphogluconolactonase [Flavilitoribacter sp.]|nr:6-phosphogluconolactonase [Flavilitoribacter sp.]HMQ91163.1 6-phosphogluconolactonase [Flavilitoribacter sp.]
MANYFHISDTTEAMSRAAADFFSAHARTAIAQTGRFTVSLSGGSTPEALFRLLASSPWKDGIDWEKVHVFWGDERCVPDDSPENNARMARSALLDHVPVPEDQIHRMNGELPPEAGAALYDIHLRESFAWELPVFDLILLGMGDDGHTASLFPHTPVLREKYRWAKEVYVEKLDSWRITLTVPVIESAACVAFLVAGGKKTAALSEVLHGAYRPEEFPSQLVARSRAEVHWFLDEAAGEAVKST